MGNAGSAPAFLAEAVPALAGKTVLITGGNTGIGFAAAQVLAGRGAAVVIASRDPAKVAAAVSKLPSGSTGEVVDLASLASIDAFVARVKASHRVIDILVDNAGVFLPPHSKTADGFEVTLGTNVIGTAHLTNGLLPLVAASPAGRIVVLSSEMASACSIVALEARLGDVGGRSVGATDVATYMESKALNTLWAEALQARLSAAEGTKHILVSSCHPGFVASDIQNKTAPGVLTAVIYAASKCVALPVETGALSTLFCATSPAAAAEPGRMWGPGPRVALFPLPPHLAAGGPYSVRAFDAVNAAIVATGRLGFVLPP